MKARVGGVGPVASAAQADFKLAMSLCKPLKSFTAIGPVQMGRWYLGVAPSFDSRSLNPG